MKKVNNILKKALRANSLTNKKYAIVCCLLIVGVLIVGCEKPYNQTIVNSVLNHLVVEGFINTGATDSTFIKLSRTVTISDNITANPETKAVINVENAQGSVYTLAEIRNGTYAAPPLSLDATKQYRIRIKTSNGKTYLSDFVDVKVAPPIDSVGYAVKSNGIQLYVNTHDPANNTRYYKYTYQETWRFHTKFYTGYISNGVYLLPRTPEQNINYCFSGDNSATTIINSTASYTRDVVDQFPITFVDATSEKIQVRYSILLKQEALTKDAYVYWQNMQKSTSQLGGIFDSQPSQLMGNVHNIANALEPVIGYISAGIQQQKRIFIDYADLPQTWATADPYGCIIDSAFNVKAQNHPYSPLVSFLILPPIRAFAIEPFTVSGGGYSFTLPRCADCTTRGTLQTPAFWK